ncbi:hypothetical protein [Paraburkholderia aromaticivorans]|uniref:hypothetical protein n=1 Tax=Paraburkholderia aromaticivorans TaxID=2026199 RepID=UPI001455DD5A|nr:hypothetical protein [Paraburkholderia aromaticivorans]
MLALTLNRTVVARVRRILGSTGGGIHKRIDENIELLELLRDRAPDFLGQHPWVVNWFESHDEFLRQLANAVPLKEGFFLHLVTPLNYIISIRCTACGETIRTTANQSPTDKDRIAAACAAGWGLAMHDDTLVFICTDQSCATQALTRKRTLRSRGIPSHRTCTLGEPE